ncbi:hypothetical protein AO067_23365 [Pseudomonas viridiflava ICMP 13104]|uniref:Uncharacterized protein n=1 Tax=Pseudomonas viridiflava ICMP 13104 TaxID=1198305 RepID=A0A0W0HX13_PSEVI|nr:hypothetical protein AO067_23365 [Pseudomonas viridiflava ICMP 13104]
MAHQRFFYHPASLWLVILITLLPASLITWTLFWREPNILSGTTASSAILFLAQGTTWASFLKLRHHKIDAYNRSFWLKALAGSGIFHITLFFLAALASSTFSPFAMFVLAGPILASCYMWILVRQSSRWKPVASVPPPWNLHRWCSLPKRAIASLTNETLPLPQPDDRQTLPTLITAAVIALIATALVSHGLATNDLVLVSKRGTFHVSGYDSIPWAGLYIALVLICISCISGHLDKRPNAHIYRRFRHLMVWVVGFLFTLGVCVTFWHLFALLASPRTH